MDLKGKRITVVGLGASGQAACRLCLANGAKVVAYDTAPNPACADELKNLGAKLSSGDLKEEVFASADIVVLSPGVDPRLPLIQKAKQKGSLVIGEMELGFRFLKAPSVMITGTNGKSTVTTLVGKMLEASGFKTFVGGNLGEPLCSLAHSQKQVDWAVLEVSSFQADTAITMCPKIGVLLNITNDHLDRYQDFEEYADSKFSFFTRQGSRDIAILNALDKNICQRADSTKAQVRFFTSKGPLEKGGWLTKDSLVFTDQDNKKVSFEFLSSKLEGGFNRLNLLVSAMAAKAAKATDKAILKVINEFEGLPHRLQYVGSLNSVDYFDDSKGTNVGAVAAALDSFERKVVLLMGGRDKDSDFSLLAPNLQDKVKTLVCFGEAGPVIERQLKKKVSTLLVSDLPKAFAQANDIAKPGELVLLSPGCASFDAYQSYGKRGEHFQKLFMEALDGP